jgi:hypothetical protein
VVATFIFYVVKCLVSYNYKDGRRLYNFLKRNIKTFKNGVEFNHPGRQNGFFGETVDVGQRTNSTLDTQSENISKVLRREATSGNGVEDSVGTQKKFRITLNGVMKSFVSQNGRFSFQEALNKSMTFNHKTSTFDYINIL